jgi:hypothetical protein
VRLPLALGRLSQREGRVREGDARHALADHVPRRRRGERLLGHRARLGGAHLREHPLERRAHVGDDRVLDLAHVVERAAELGLRAIEYAELSERLGEARAHEARAPSIPCLREQHDRALVRREARLDVALACRAERAQAGDTRGHARRQ